MSIASIDFDLIIVTPMRDSIVAHTMFRSCLVMISYREILVDLVFLDLQDFDVILRMNWFDEISRLLCS